MKIHPALLAVALCAGLAHAHPDHGDRPYGARDAAPAPAARNVAIEMNEMGCSPAEVTAAPGDTIRFTARNPTKVARDLAVGPVEELKAHAEMVRKFPGMQGGKGSRVSVKPGRSADLAWKATRAGRFVIACAPPGHFDASGAGQIVVGKP